MYRRRLTVFPWGMLETTEYVDRDDESTGVFDPESDSDQYEPPTPQTGTAPELGQDRRS